MPTRTRKRRLQDSDDDHPPGKKSKEANDLDDSGEDDLDDLDDEDYLSEREIRKTDPTAYKALCEIRQEIVRTEPNLMTILREPYIIEDRVRIFQLWEIYQTHTPNTEEWLSARGNLVQLIAEARNRYECHARFTPDQHARMDQEVREFGRGTDSRLTMKYQILELQTSIDNKASIYRRYEEFLSMDTSDDEHGKLKNWLQWAVSLSHDRIKSYAHENTRQFLREVARKFDAALHGMHQVKEQLLVFLNAKLLNPSMQRVNLGLVGPPGTGKTAIAQLIAQTMGIPFQQVFFGGMSGPEFLKGQDYTYIGSHPGEIVKCLSRMGYKNGILYFDEFEKVASNDAMCAALLGICDSTQNSEFKDSFLSDITIDLSHLWFVKSMNALPTDPALRDRIFSIKVPGYTPKEKICITERHLLPRACLNVGLDSDSIVFARGVTRHFVARVCSSDIPGVRTIDKAVGDLVNKVHFIERNQGEDGVLDDLEVSFHPKERIGFPLRLTTALVDRLTNQFDLPNCIESIYM